MSYYEMGYPQTNLVRKCHYCKWYQPLIKEPWHMTGLNTKFARGSCKITGTYKQRTEMCKKYEEVVEYAQMERKD